MTEPKRIGSANRESQTWWGIDGCRAGWICIGLDKSSIWQARVVGQASKLVKLPGGVGPALIDIPIGLVEKGPEGRQCDRAARKVLRFPRSCSVFSAPARPSLAAESYRNACEVNLVATGKKVSRQAFGIAKKIQEVDVLLRSEPASTKSLRECHPEVCFWALNRGEPMKHNKKKRAGRLERINVLTRFVANTGEIVSEVAATWRRKDVAHDDIVDALVAAVTARLGASGLRTLPESPSLDAQGLPMEIVYARP